MSIMATCRSAAAQFPQALAHIVGLPDQHCVFCDSQVRVIPHCSGTVTMQGCAGLLGCVQYRVFCSEL